MIEKANWKPLTYHEGSELNLKSAEPKGLLVEEEIAEDEEHVIDCMPKEKEEEKLEKVCCVSCITFSSYCCCWKLIFVRTEYWNSMSTQEPLQTCHCNS